MNNFVITTKEILIPDGIMQVICVIGIIISYLGYRRTKRKMYAFRMQAIYGPTHNKKLKDNNIPTWEL